MNLQEQVKTEVNKRINRLRDSQHSDGSWRYCFENHIMTDSFMIMMMRSLGIKDEDLIHKLAARIIAQQTNDGVWKLYEDEEKGNLSATVQAYNALLFSGKFKKEDRIMRKAERFICENGGLRNVHFMTKWMLAVNGQYRWPKVFYVPLTLLLISPHYPVSFFSLSSYARIHFVPMMIAANKKFSITSKWTPDLSHLLTREGSDFEEWDLLFGESRSGSSFFYQEITKLASFPSYLHRLGYQYAERYMLERIEKDGTLYSYSSATIFMIYALLALQYTKDAPIIQHAISGLKSLVKTCNGNSHLENSTSTVWDTALLSYTLQEAGVPSSDPMIRRSLSYLLKRQHTKLADWAFHNPSVPPGGWGFSHINTNNPDLDDTSAALRAITNKSLVNNRYRHSWQLGLNWLLSMQNRNGGFAAFEKNTDNLLFTYIPLENAEDASIDLPSADLTGRVLEFLGNFAGIKKPHPTVSAAVKWLLDNQEANGSWYGRWGVCYIYGSWAALTGLRAARISRSHSQTVKAINWLKSIQHKDGGWGESCKSAQLKKFFPLSFSTPSQTAWAVDALLTVCPKEDKAIQKGIHFLLQTMDSNDNRYTYPTGIGLPGQFYIHYHSYNEIFPLLTFAHFLKKV